MAPSKTKNFIDLTVQPPANDDLKRDVTALRQEIITLARILMDTNAMMALLALQLHRPTQPAPAPAPTQTIN